MDKSNYRMTFSMINNRKKYIHCFKCVFVMALVMFTPVTPDAQMMDAGVEDTSTTTGATKKTNPIAQSATRHLRSMKWSYDAPPPNRYKCNIFVHDIIKEAGIRAPINPTTKRPVMAARWADERNVDLQGWHIVRDGAAEARAGDVVAYHNPSYQESTGHVGIVVSDGPNGVTISASGGGAVILDRLGFDNRATDGGRKGYVFRRWTGKGYHTGKRQ